MSGDPKRLLVHPDTDEATRRDLERTLAAPPPPYDASKGLTRLLAATAPAAAAGVGAGAVVKAAKWAAYVKWSLGGSALLATAVVSTTVVLSHKAENANLPAPPPAVQTAAAPGPVNAPAPVEPPAPAVPAPVVEIAPAPSASSSPPSASVRGRHRAQSQSSEPTSADDRVAREVALLGRARSALASNPAQALALSEEGHRDFPRGVLREERESIAVLALVRLGRTTEANARGKAFLERYPHGPFSEKVRGALGQTGAPP